MSDTVIKNLCSETHKKLSDRAAARNRTVEEEAVSIIESALQMNEADAVEIARAIRGRLSGRQHTDSTSLLAQGRGR